MRIFTSIFVPCVVVICLAACDGSKPLHFDPQGKPHGSGEKVYYYDTGEIKLREQYINGQCEMSEWYAPDGALIEKTDWVNGAGEGLYLREDGSIRVRMTYSQGIANGPATYYDEEGNVTKIVEFRDGQPVAE